MTIVMRLEQAFDEARGTRQKLVQFDLNETDYAELCRLAATHRLPANVGWGGEVNAYRKVPLYLDTSAILSVATFDNGTMCLSSGYGMTALPSSWRPAMLH